MREIKFRYIVTEPAKNITHRLYHTLEGIERLDPNHQIFKPSYKIVAKDLYTGLKDKNGVEIYEGDVVEMISMGPGGVDLKGVVEMAEGSFYICSHENQLSTYLFNELSVIEIIGNIYEHPHLLEASE